MKRKGAKKQRTENPKKTQVNLRVDTEFLTQVDERAKSLGIDRTQYVLGVVKQDLDKGGDFTISPRSDAPKPKPPPVSKAYIVPPSGTAMNDERR